MATNKMKAARGLLKTFTTSQVGYMLAISPRTVVKLCDSGQLPCYRIGADARGGDRRIPREDLIRYLATRPELRRVLARVAAAHGVILCGVADAVVEQLPEDWQHARCNDIYGLGYLAASGAALAILDATGLGTTAALTAARYLRRMDCTVVVFLAADGVGGATFQGLDCLVYPGPAGSQTLRRVIDSFWLARNGGSEGCP